MAGESMREDVSLKPQPEDQLLAPELADQSKEPVQLTESQGKTEEKGPELKPALFPKTQGCQTELVEEVAGVEERAVSSVAAVVEGRRTGWLRGLLRLLVGFLALLLVFTFLCGYEYEGRVYYPITYSPLRFVNVTKCMHAGFIINISVWGFFCSITFAWLAISELFSCMPISVIRSAVLLGISRLTRTKCP